MTIIIYKQEVLCMAPIFLGYEEKQIPPGGTLHPLTAYPTQVVWCSQLQSFGG